jgi:hypothetical protein
LPPVGAFALDSGARARATARGVRGGARPARGASFCALPGRDGAGGGRVDKEKAADAERLNKILRRDPHAPELLETLDDLLQQ